MKLFGTRNMDIVKYCQEQFHFKLPNDTLARRTRNVLDKINQRDNCYKMQYVYNKYVFTVLYFDLYKK